MTPPMVPPRTAVTALTRTSIVQLGDEPRQPERSGASRRAAISRPSSRHLSHCAPSPSLGWGRDRGGRHQRRRAGRRAKRAKDHRGLARRGRRAGRRPGGVARSWARYRSVPAAARCCASSRPRWAPVQLSRSAPARASPASSCCAAWRRGRRAHDRSTSRASAERVAEESFAEAGIPSGRARLITGRALDVLPRLTDGGYDLVFCDAAKAEYGDYLGEACGCCDPVAWSRSTTRCGTAGCRTRPTATARDGRRP